MKASPTYFMLMAAAYLLLALCGCSHKDIMTPGSEMRQVTLSFEWDNAPEASPEGMTVYFFPECESGRIWRFDIAGSAGGPVEIPTGRYSLVAFNNDLPGISVSGSGSYQTIAADARFNSAHSALTSTGMLYRAESASVEVTHCGISYITPDGSVKDCGKSLLRCYPDSAATVYTVILKNVKGAERMKSTGAIIKNVAPSVLLHNGETFGKPEGLSMILEKDEAISGLTSEAAAFAPAGQLPDTLTVAVTRLDGKSFAKDIALNTSNMNPMSPKHVVIVIDGLELPEGGTSGEDVGGIDVGVEGWTVIEIEVGPAFS